MRKKFLLVLTLLILALGGGGKLFAENGNVAKVGNTEYASIDAAIAAWTNNTTLTLLGNVTLSDVVKLKSTEHHTLNLGTYTMTAASGKNAIEITCEGRSKASYALTVNAEATNPGGITATGAACIYYKKSGSTKDRPIILINNGVFNGSYSINSISNGNTNCPQIWINGGTFNGNVNLTKNMLCVYGGTFNGWINCTGDQNAYRLIAGGTFKQWQFMTADATNKFAVSSAMSKDDNGNWIGTYNVGVHVDDNGYLVVGGDVVTEPGNFEASSANYGGWSSCLKYSSAKDNGLYYTSVEEALADNKKTTGVVTVYADEIDMTDIDDFKGTIIIPAGKKVTITNAPADLKVATAEGYEIVKNNDVYESVSTIANVATKAELQAALANANIKTIVLTADIDYGTDQLAITKAITLDLGGKTLTTRNAWGGMSIKGNPTVKNGNIVHASNTAAIKVWNATAFENLVIDVQGKGDANKTIGGIVLQSGSETRVGSIKNVTIKGAALTNGIETYNCGDATENVIGSMENVTIDAVGTGMLISAPCGTATNCDIKGGVNGIEIWIKGNYSASLDLVASKVEGGVYAHDEFNSNPDVVNNGILKLTADEATTGAGVEDVTLTIARAKAENVQGEIFEYIMENAEAKGNNTFYASLQAALNDAAAGTGNVTVEILDNINLTGIDWNPVTVSAPGYPVVTVEGNNNTITGLNDMLFAATWAGNSGLIIKNLTIENSTIENDKNDAVGNVGVGAFVGYPQASAIITLENCHLKNSSVEGGHWTGGLIGMAGGYNGADGPVFMNLTIKGCSVTGSTITGKGSVGGVIGHGSCSAWTNVVIEETTVSDNAITSTGTSVNKAGAVMGTIGAAGQATTVNGVEKQGGALVAATVSDNTVTSNGTAITTIYGRQGTNTGVLELNGGSYDNYPIEEGVAYAKPIDGYKIKENNGTYGIVALESKEYEVNESFTLAQAIAQCKADGTDIVTYKISGAATLETGFSHGIVDFGGKDVTIIGKELSENSLTIVGGGVPDIKGVAFKNITIADEGTYLPTANEFMYQNFIDCTFENVKFEDGIRLSGNCNIKDCTVNANTANEYAIWLDAGQFEITGTNVEVGNDAYGMIKSDLAEKIVIKNNTFTYLGKVNKEALNTKGAVIIAEGNTFIDCAKGIVPADKQNYTEDGEQITDAIIDVNNEIINYVAQIGTTKYETLAAAVDAAQENDEVVIFKAGTYALKVKNNVTITGAVNGVEFANIGAFGCNGANVTFNNVTFTYTNSSTYKGLQHSGNLVYNNCTFNGQVFLYGASETFNNCTFNTTDSNNYNVWTYGAKNVAFNECTFNSAGKSVLIYAESASVTNNVSVAKCQFEASQVVEGKAAIEMDSSLTGGINLTIDAETTASGFGKGNVSNNSLWNNKKGNADAANNDITVTVDNTVVLKPIILALEGEGTVENPYLINNLEELVWFRDNVDKTSQDGSTQYAGKYIKLTADIDLAGINWNPIGSMSSDHGSFKGVFDGDNHIIKNLNCEQAGNGLGLFARTAGNAEIKNLKLNNVTVKSTDNSSYVGGVVGNAYASTKIENVHISGDVQISGRGYIGGIAGHGYVVMDKVSVVAKEGSLITSTFWCAGGILGYAGEGSTNIMNANVEGITITSAAGGLGAIVGMAEDNNGTQPISGSNLSAKNVDIKTYVGAYGTSYANYALGYLYGGNETSILTGELSVENVNVITSTGEKAKVVDAVANVDGKIYFNLASAIATIGNGDVTINLLRDVTLDYNARDEYGIEGTTSVTINGNNHTLTLNQKNSDWASIGLVNGKLVLNNMTIEKTGYGDTSGAWNTHAIIFSCPLEMTNVTVNNGIAVQAGATLDNVTINEAGEYYGLWINGNGQSVTMKGGSITATTGGRGIKIADQYIDNPAQVTLNVTETVFTTAKKAAVLVSSKAGAKIAASNVNIENVAADKVNFVWVDEDWAANYGNVEVTGAEVAQESIESFVAEVKKDAKVEGYYASLQAAIEDAQNGETVILFANTDEVVSVNVLNKEISIVGEEDLFPVLTGGLDFGIDNHSQDAGNITIKGIKFVGNGIRIDDMASVTIEGNIFEDITASNAIYVAADEYTTTLAITNNIITKVAGAGINLRNPINATVTGNTITNVTGNAMTFQNNGAIEDVAGEIVITGNVLTDWAYGKTEGEGRAIRLALGNIADNVIIEENAMIAANAPEEFVKISGTSNAEISVDENYWNGVEPKAQHFLADGVQIHNYYASYDEANGLQDLVTIAGETLEIFYTAAGVETTKEQAVYSLSFAVTDYVKKEASVKIGSKNPAENKNYDLIIPSSVEFDGVTYAVTSIPEKGFIGCKGFDKLVVPGTITSVSASAFHNCSRLKEIIIEEGVQKLGKESFYKISDLETLTLPSTLTRIETLCFNGTHNIKTIVCNAQTPPTAFKGSFTELIYKNALVYVAGEYEDYKAATGWQNFNNIIAVGATQTIVKTNYTLIATITDIWNKTCSVKIGTAPTNTKHAQLEIPEHVSFSGIKFDITSIPESGFQDCKYFEGTLTIPAYITSIDSIAFNGCSGITELVVEEGVTSLGTYGTFEGCRDIETIILPSTLETIPSRCFHNIQQKLNTIVCYAMTPPTLGSNFSDGAINDGLTLYVHNVDAYKKAARWKKIKSIRLIGAVAQNMTTSREYKSLQEAINEAAGATVKVLDNVVLEEAITVAAGAEVTLDLNGKVVSYESAVVGEDMITNNGKLTVESSVAGGKITYNNTDETGSNVTISTISTVPGSELIINGGIIENTSLANYSSRVLVPYAIDILTNGGLGDVAVTINGGEIVSTNYIAIRQFVNGNVCNNSLTVTGGTITGLKRAINVQDAQGNGQVKNCAILLVEAGDIIAGEGGYAICNFANSENVALTGGNFVGTVYSAIEGIISGGTFSEEPYSGYLADGFICEPNADGTYSVIEEPIYTQTIQLSAGWNWFSSYVETDLDSLQNALGENGVMIKNHHHGYTENEDGEWWGTLDTFDSEQMYLIKINEDQQLKIKGEMINPSEHPISINQGWNAIAYMLNTSMSLKDALASINPIEGDYIKGRTGYAEFDGEEWFGDLSTMIPGEGYMFKNSSDEVRTLTYSYPTRGTNTEAKANVTTDGNHWIPSSSQFANNMTMTAVLDVENINYEVAAFVNGECRGSARPIYVEALDAYMLFLTIHGEEVEEMTFKYYDIDTDIEYTLSDRINYSNNAILGSLKEPYMFTRGTTDIGEAELSQLNIYPNPTTTAAEINLNATFDKVEVFNALGVKVAEYSNVDSIDALETAGIYVIRATNDSVISHCRLVVK